MLTDAEKRGRLNLTSIGFNNLLNSNAPLKRAQIFDVNGHSVSPKDAKEIEKASGDNSRQWQNHLLERMVEQGLIVKNAQGNKADYTTKAPKKIRDILKDHNDYGFKLAKLLFPGEVTDPTAPHVPGMFSEPSEEAPPAETEEEPGKPQQEPVSGEFLEEIVNILDAQRNSMEEMLEGIQALVDDQAAIKTRQTRIEKQLGDMNSALNGAVRKLGEATNSQLDLEALSPVFEGFSVHIENVVEKQLASVLNAINTTKTAAIKTHGKLEETMRLFKDAQKDMKGKALRDLRAAVELIADSIEEDPDG